MAPALASYLTLWLVARSICSSAKSLPRWSVQGVPGLNFKPGKLRPGMTKTMPSVSTRAAAPAGVRAILHLLPIALPAFAPGKRPGAGDANPGRQFGLAIARLFGGLFFHGARNRSPCGRITGLLAAGRLRLPCLSSTAAACSRMPCVRHQACTRRSRANDQPLPVSWCADSVLMPTLRFRRSSTSTI